MSVAGSGKAVEVYEAIGAWPDRNPVHFKFDCLALLGEIATRPVELVLSEGETWAFDGERRRPLCHELGCWSGEKAEHTGQA